MVDVTLVGPVSGEYMVVIPFRGRDNVIYRSRSQSRCRDILRVASDAVDLGLAGRITEAPLWRLEDAHEPGQWVVNGFLPGALIPVARRIYGPTSQQDAMMALYAIRYAYTCGFRMFMLAGVLDNGTH